MISTYINQSSYSLGETEQDHTQSPFLKPRIDTSPFSCSLILDTLVHEVNDRRQHHHEQHRPHGQNEHFLVGESNTHRLSIPTTKENYIMPQSSPGQHNKVEDANGSARWISSKMRLMRKMLVSDQISASKPRNIQGDHNYQQVHQRSRRNSSRMTNLPEGFIRVCSDCNTTKTPLWRSGPQGPKSLCNACGIRQRKARRAMAAAALGSALIPADTTSDFHKLKRSDGDHTVPFKKRFKISTTETRQNFSSNETAIKLSKNSVFQPEFPHDEKDAAILLMGLSYGPLPS